MAYIDKTKLLTDVNNGIKAGNLEEGYEQYQNINNMDDIIEAIEWADEVDVVERSEYDRLEKRYKLCKRLTEQGNELRLKIDKILNEMEKYSTSFEYNGRPDLAEVVDICIGIVESNIEMKQGE